MLNDAIIISFIKKLLKKKSTKKPQQTGIQEPSSPNYFEGAQLVTREHHPISKVNISDNALKVLNRLTSQLFNSTSHLQTPNNSRYSIPQMYDSNTH
jgi:hypothetical protein